MIRGVGCILIEMIQGSAAFPGVKDANDQLDKIWRVLGTPKADSYDGINDLPNFRPERFHSYPGQRLISLYSKINNITGAEDYIKQFLQLDPKKRITADDGLKHRFFTEFFPPRVYELTSGMLINWLLFDSTTIYSFLPTEESIFTVKGIKLYPESSQSNSSSSSSSSSSQATTIAGVVIQNAVMKACASRFRKSSKSWPSRDHIPVPDSDPIGANRHILKTWFHIH